MASIKRNFHRNKDRPSMWREPTYRQIQPTLPNTAIDYSPKQMIALISFKTGIESN